MGKRLQNIESVRASRDGHEFHETWTARKALQLLLPTDGLVGIAVEGLSPADQAQASKETVEIADLVLYYGRFPTFEDSKKQVILQFKYSISAKDKGLGHSDAKKTIIKFAAAYRSYKRNYGNAKVDRRLEFQLVTNRPILPEFSKAIGSIAAKRKIYDKKIKRQADRFRSSCKLRGNDLVQFTRKLSIVGLAGNLTANQRHLSRVLVDWSAAPDALSRARLGRLKELVRDKAGSKGSKQNIIRRADLFAALELQGEEDLFPCREGFPAVSKIVEPDQLFQVAKQIPQLQKPLVIHASGGVGKTVFLQSLSKVLARNHEVVLFDCFGGGAYRAPEDSRHLPKRGLIHIANDLARRGLCDPLLPSNGEDVEIIEAFRRRLKAVVNTLRRASPSKQLFLFLDAIDNAAEYAQERREQCFPRLLLESIHHSGPIGGMQLIVSCRSYRIELSKGEVACDEFKLEPFTVDQTGFYLKQRLSAVTGTEVQVAHARSGGNARILAHLAESGRGVLDVSEIDNPIELDDLLTRRITAALSDALKLGYKQSEIEAFLAGLCILPPPVPLREYAAAHQFDDSAIESFAADLAPLLEKTTHGLVFRDEPTETLMRNTYGSNVAAVRRVASNLLANQSKSVYAARALPGLLQRLNDGEGLFDLAFDERFPEAITSAVGKEAIRYSRLKAAVLHAVQKPDYGHLVRLLSELSTIAAVNQRGTRYVLENPDLVIAAEDVDATRRLFETRTEWQGTRHARLVIANLLSGQFNDAYRHTVRASEWIQHYALQADDRRGGRAGPEALDIAAIPLCLIADDRPKDAASFMAWWKEWYEFEAAEKLFDLLSQLEATDPKFAQSAEKFLLSLVSEAGVIAAALAFRELSDDASRHLISALRRACASTSVIDADFRFYNEKTYTIKDGLLKASVIAISLGRHDDALAFSAIASRERPRLSTFEGPFADREIFHFVCPIAVSAAARGEAVVESTVLPCELFELCGSMPSGTTGPEFGKWLKADIARRHDQKVERGSVEKTISYDFKMSADRFIDGELTSIARLTDALARLVAARGDKVDKEFTSLIELWTEVRDKTNSYRWRDDCNRFFDHLARRLAFFGLWVRSDLSRQSIESLWHQLKDNAAVTVANLIECVSIVSKRNGFGDLAGEMAMRARALIEQEADVSARAAYYAQLSRAILAASKTEASVYFRAGLEQMDAIGSGDYGFTNELLLFAAAAKGPELNEKDFHTLTNICELNIPDESEKFPWAAFGDALSRVSGMRAIAKLGRWDDRSKAAFDYTLLPYLKALVQQRKIRPTLAVALLRISDPAEFWDCDSADFASAIAKTGSVDAAQLVSEVLEQYQENNSRFPSDAILDKFRLLAEEIFGANSRETRDIADAALRFRRSRNEQNEHTNFRGSSGRASPFGVGQFTAEVIPNVESIASSISPYDEEALSKAIENLNRTNEHRDMCAAFLSAVRSKVQFAERTKYIEAVSRLKNVSIYPKIAELGECKKEWSQSSVVLTGFYRDLAIELVRRHAPDFISNEYFSSYLLQNVGTLCGVPLVDLALELIKTYSVPDCHVPASVWMRFATLICDRAPECDAQAALKRLLNSRAARLASSVADGDWRDGLYPQNDESEIASGLVWLKLGSASAPDRWRAAHCVRTLARLKSSDVIDSLFTRIRSRDAGSFQASELKFYFLHASLWLLIAMARIAYESPEEIERFVGHLTQIARSETHVLVRHFAASAALACARAGRPQLSDQDIADLEKINKSPFSPVKTRGVPRRNSSGSVTDYSGDFHLDYDFDKYDVDSLSRVFGLPKQRIERSISLLAKDFDPDVTSMYDRGGRANARASYSGMKSDYHLYGQQLGWHCLALTAGQLLATYPVTDDSYEPDPWPAWLRRRLLSRKDDLWLADGLDLPPAETQVNLLEEGEKELILTGNREKISRLLNLKEADFSEIVVEGDWRSLDRVRVSVSSTLVTPSKVGSLTKSLLDEEPFRAWLPTYEAYETGEEYERNEKPGYAPWIACPSFEAALDENDPFGSVAALRRPYFAKSVRDIQALKSDDPFGRSWSTRDDIVVSHAEAWGHDAREQGEVDSTGTRLTCSAKFLKTVLSKKKSHLLVLVKLERYEESSSLHPSRWTNTVFVIHVMPSLKFEYHAGAVNKLFEAKY